MIYPTLDAATRARRCLATNLDAIITIAPVVGGFVLRVA